MPRLIVFTDLDGSLLDGTTYSYEAATPALAALREQGIPLILVSVKRGRKWSCFDNTSTTVTHSLSKTAARCISLMVSSFPFERMRTDLPTKS
jgi:predicted mannosyl-3-phosphoglycerate phosphatase (HAD superfamily)